MKEYKISSSKDKKENAVIIDIDGHLGLNQMNRVQSEILKTIKGVAKATFQVKDVIESDLSFFQLVFAIKKYCIKYKIKYKFEIDLPADQLALFAKSGINLSL
jgi:hypothetical protein